MTTCGENGGRTAKGLPCRITIGLVGEGRCRYHVSSSHSWRKERDEFESNPEVILAKAAERKKNAERRANGQKSIKSTLWIEFQNKKASGSSIPSTPSISSMSLSPSLSSSSSLSSLPSSPSVVSSIAQSAPSSSSSTEVVSVMPVSSPPSTVGLTTDVRRAIAQDHINYMIEERAREQDARLLTRFLTSDVKRSDVVGVSGDFVAVAGSSTVIEVNHRVNESKESKDEVVSMSTVSRIDGANAGGSSSSGSSSSGVRRSGRKRARSAKAIASAVSS